LPVALLALEVLEAKLTERGGSGAATVSESNLDSERGSDWER
tara:strand:+ start:46 stop:171 length:126 start_codon:yes stop_codon:yes gene_type:complete